MTKDYHEYVISDGKFIGNFEEMYQKCADPWPESDFDLDSNVISTYVANIIKKNQLRKIFSFGLGKAKHLIWLENKIKDELPGMELSGCDISNTCIEFIRENHKEIKAFVGGVSEFISHRINFDVIIFREVIWYILPELEIIFNNLLERHKGSYIIIELSFYDDQKYGLEHFHGFDSFLKRIPFRIIEVLRHHSSSMQMEGFTMIFAKIE